VLWHRPAQAPPSGKHNARRMPHVSPEAMPDYAKVELAPYGTSRPRRIAWLKSAGKPLERAAARELCCDAVVVLVTMLDWPVTVLVLTGGVIGSVGNIHAVTRFTHTRPSPRYSN
jgi:hypothetical protein